MIETLTLTHFKKHKAATFRFETGLNVITGPNGIGKSTLLKGVLYCLFGATAAGRKEHLTTWASEGQMEGTLVITLPTHGKVTIARSNRNATVMQGDQLLASGQSPVTAFVEEAFGLPAKLFCLLMVSPQGDAKALLELGAAGLQAKLEAVAKLEVVDKVLTLLREDTGVDKKVLETLPPVPDLVELGTQLEIKQLELTQAETLRINTETTLANTTSEVMTANTRLKGELEPLKAAWTQANTTVNVLRDTVANARLKLDELLSTAPEGDIVEETLKLKAVATERDGERDLLSALKQQEANTVVAHKALERAKTELDYYEGMKEAWQRVELLKQQVDSTTKLVSESRGRVTELNKVPMPELSCNACGRPYGDTEEDRAALQREQAAWRQTQLQAEDAAKFAQQSKAQAEEDYANAVQDTGVAERAWDEYPRKATTARVRHTEAEAVMNTLLESHNKATVGALLDYLAREMETSIHRMGSLQSQENEQAKQVQDLTTWAALKAQLERSVEQSEQGIQTAIASLPVIPEDLDEQIDTLGQFINSESEFCAQLAAAVTASKVKEAELQAEKTRLTDTLQAAQALSDQRAKLEAELATRTALQTFLTSNRTKFVKDTWEALLTYANALLDMTTEGLITALQRSDAGEFTVNEEADNVPVSELSGARQSIVGLCLRIALGRVFYGDQGFLLLDEVTADCNEENAARIAGLLQSLGVQVLMVTHREGDAVNAANLIAL